MFDLSPFADLLHWADIIDGAKFESADAAVTLAAPAMKIATVIEAATDPGFITRIIPLLTAQSLVDTLQEDFVQEALAPRIAKQEHDVTLMRSRAAAQHGVITFDLTDQNAEGYSKFIPYYLLPEAVYAVGISKTSTRLKISVGTSPWTTVPKDRLANIARHLRAIWRRRAPAGGRDQPARGPDRRSEADRGDCDGGVAGAGAMESTAHRSCRTCGLAVLETAKAPPAERGFCVAAIDQPGWCVKIERRLMSFHMTKAKKTRMQTNAAW